MIDYQQITLMFHQISWAVPAVHPSGSIPPLQLFYLLQLLKVAVHPAKVLQVRLFYSILFSSSHLAFKISIKENKRIYPEMNIFLISCKNFLHFWICFLCDLRAPGCWCRHRLVGTREIGSRHQACCQVCSTLVWTL